MAWNSAECSECPSHAFLFSFYFFLHVNKLLLAVVEFVLQECEFLRRNDVYSQSVLYLPLALEGNKSLVDVSGYVWMDVQIECFYSNLVYESVYLTLELIRENYARLYLSLTKACRAGFLYVDIHCRTNPLARNLH